MNIENKILNRINELLETELKQVSPADASEVFFAVTNIFETIYGPQSTQIGLVQTLHKEAKNRFAPESEQAQFLVMHLHAYLRELKAALKEGRIVNIQSEARGEALGDFLVLARESLDAEQKDVAAVLACAALEDALKRCASDRGLHVQDKNMNDVVNALKTEGIIRKNEGALLSAFVRLRNDAFHARWTAIDTTGVTSIIAFTEEFLAKQF